MSKHAAMSAKKRDLSARHPQRLREMVSKAENWSKTHTQPLWFDTEQVKINWNAKSMPNYETTFKVN